MNHLLEDDPELMPRRERELTLSTGAILAIFFGLVLLCGFFFALGYNLRKPAQPVATADSPAAPSADTSRFDHFNKPAAGLPQGSQPATPPPAPVAATQPQSEPATPAAESEPAGPTARPVTLSHPAPPAEAAPTAPRSMPATSPAGAFTVQVAAVSHQEDAELLVGALRSKGYTVAAHTVPQDKLFHIQVGPFADRKDAETMRQRLLGDGYNAIVK